MMECVDKGRMTPPISKRVDLSEIMPQRTEQNVAAMLRLCISLKGKLSARSDKTFRAMSVDAFSAV